MTELEEFVKDLDTRIKKLEGKEKPEKEKKSVEQTFDEQVFGKRAG